MTTHAEGHSEILVTLGECGAGKVYRGRERAVFWGIHRSLGWTGEQHSSGTQQGGVQGTAQLSGGPAEVGRSRGGQRLCGQAPGWAAGQPCRSASQGFAHLTLTMASQEGCHHQPRADEKTEAKVLYLRSHNAGKCQAPDDQTFQFSSSGLLRGALTPHSPRYHSYHCPPVLWLELSVSKHRFSSRSNKCKLRLETCTVLATETSHLC